MWVLVFFVSALYTVRVDAANIFFSINDATTGSPLYKEGTCNALTDALNISGTYTLSAGNVFTISSSSVGPARVTCSESDDILRLENAIFTWVSGTVSNVKITIWRTYTSTYTNPVTYSVYANGTFYGTPNGSWVSLRGYVQNASLGALAAPSNPPTCNLTQLTRCATTNVGTWAFTSSTFSKSSSISPPTTRTLTGKFWFKLVSGANLQIDNMNVNFGPPAGPCDDEEEECENEDPCAANGNTSQSRTPIPNELIFVQCVQESTISAACKEEGKKCPVCMIRQNDGMPADPKSGKKIKDAWIRLNHDNENP